MAVVYLILALVIAVVAVLFAWQNPDTVNIRFFGWGIEEAPQSLVLLATLAIGILIGWLFAAPSLVRNAFRSSNQRKRIGALEKELDGHKSKPSEPKPAGSPKPVETPKQAPVTPPSPAATPPRPATPTSATAKSDTDPLGHS